MSVEKKNNDLSSSFISLRKIIDIKEVEYRDLLVVSPHLKERLISYRNNNKRPVYRLFEYHEGFSVPFVSYFIDRFNLDKGPILDPFSGTAITSLVSSQNNIPSTGIELLPIGNLIAKARYQIGLGLSSETLERIRFWKEEMPWKKYTDYPPLPTLKITEGAYPLETEKEISQYLCAMRDEKEDVHIILQFAICSILEKISYTRKDGQVLRWDYRSGRGAAENSFDKGQIYQFSEAIADKLSDIIEDSTLETLAPSISPVEKYQCPISLIEGSCLTEIQKIEENSFQAIITAPPFCNTYDYTITYALELAILGVKEKECDILRQTMLSCTLENRQKDLLAINKNWTDILSYCSEHNILNTLKDYLLNLEKIGKLNHTGIPHMIDAYFKEIACLIFESARILEKGGYMFMFSSNLMYSRAYVPVDIMFSDIAKQCGFEIDEIIILPPEREKRNRHMGLYRQDSLRKSVSVWRKV
ncbi:MAG: site-specific DNA-methyltransferase [Alphaproteobacteria bacterium]